jgi:hypothetical protein
MVMMKNENRQFHRHNEQNYKCMYEGQSEILNTEIVLSESKYINTKCYGMS